MSRKTKLAIPPGVELDWDNEDHRRHIDDEAFAEEPKPRPTMKPPARSRFWWFWRWFGLFVYRPLRYATRIYFTHHYTPGTRWEHRYRYPWLFAKQIANWLRRGPTWGPGAFWLRRLIAWAGDERLTFTCPHCGFRVFEEDITLFNEDGSQTKIELFEHVEGGGVDYFGEAEDYSGWQWCYRCGTVSWETH